MSDATRQRQIRDLLLQLAPTEGYTVSPIASVRWLRSNRALDSTPVLYEPGIVFVCQGRKRGFIGDRTLVYDARHYLVVAVPVPFTMETDASEAAPLLAAYLRLDPALAAEVALAIDQSGIGREDTPPGPAAPLGLEASPMDDRIEGSLLRFLEAMADPVETAVLGPSLLRELYFRILCGAQGATLRSVLGERGHLGRIALALKRIHADDAERLDVSRLACQARVPPALRADAAGGGRAPESLVRPAGAGRRTVRVLSLSGARGAATGRIPATPRHPGTGDG